MPPAAPDHGFLARLRRDPSRPGFLERILPRSALGLAGLLFMMSLAAALSGTVLFAFYSTRLQDTRDEVNQVKTQIADDLESAKQILDQEKEAALTEIDEQLNELEKFSASGETLEGLLEDVKPSVFFVATRDVDGAPAVGTAFVVASDAEQSLMVTSYNTIRAATAEPAPPIEVRKGDERIEARLNGWDEGRDLALLIVNRANLPALKWAEGSPSVRTGDRIFAVSGLGAAGGAISQGFVADVSGSGVQHDAPIGAAFQGGPLINSRAEVVAVASRAYSPLGFDPKAVFFGVPIRTACEQVLGCPDQ